MLTKARIAGHPIHPMLVAFPVALYVATVVALFAFVGTDDAFWYLTEKKKIAAPIMPPPLQNHGNYVVSLGELVRWLAPIVGENRAIAASCRAAFCAAYRFQEYAFTTASGAIRSVCGWYPGQEKRRPEGRRGKQGQSPLQTIWNCTSMLSRIARE